MRGVLTIAAVIACAGCSSTTMSNVTAAPATTPVALRAPDVDNVKLGVSALLRDPPSAVFGRIAAARAADGTTYVCGLVNAKNGFGGYTGEVPFAGTLAADRFQLVAMGGTANETWVASDMCRRYGVAL